MRKLFCTFLLSLFACFSAQVSGIGNGEQLNYRIHYGILNAGAARLVATDVSFQGRPHLHVVGTGRTAGAVSAFFKVNDVYESYIDLSNSLPSYYVRNVAEGSYRNHYEAAFDHRGQKLVLMDKLKNESKTVHIAAGMQDMLSCFYYLRSLDASRLQHGNSIRMNVWIDSSSYSFLLKVVGTMTVQTKFGKINCLKIIPSVMSGRVFKKEEGVVMYVTNDANHIPVKLTAELAVGTLTADLDSYYNVRYPMNFR